MRYLILILGVLLVNGCLARTYTIEKPRVDTEISAGANRGYINGTPKNDPSKKPWLKDTRTLSVLEIEMGSHTGKKTLSRENQPAQTSIEQELNTTEQIPESWPEHKAVIEQQADLPASNACSQEYIIVKSDTLQKISEKFYGTSKNWYKIYKANKNILKNPNRIIPGKKLCIPDIGQQLQSVKESKTALPAEELK